jgi:hypothetical protein
MRACFLGQNICALGNGFAILHATPITRRSVAAHRGAGITDLNTSEMSKSEDYSGSRAELLAQFTRDISRTEAP